MQIIFQNYTSINSRQIGNDFKRLQPAAGKNAADVFRLADTDFQNHPAAGFQQCRSQAGNLPVMVKSVRAAVQRTQWVVVFYFGCQSRNIRNRNIRRIGNQHIQRQPQSRGQIVIKPAGFQPGDLRFLSELPSILRGNLQCFGGAIYPCPCQSLFSASRDNRIQPEPVPKSAIF